eukprot:6205640-Pleurochrysis_carterae.AAC.3
MDIVYASELSRAASNHDEKQEHRTTVMWLRGCASYDYYSAWWVLTQVASLLASNASVHDKDSLEQTPLILCVRGRADDEAAAEARAFKGSHTHILWNHVCFCGQADWSAYSDADMDIAKSAYACTHVPEHTHMHANTNTRVRA